ncbi:MAG: methyltransferase domain-containing protein [Hamadaea sp.]|uniref:class I SAM-dependent methyltransferase n=1 Tax=Hamadaea sp. TaxID=2024425 RepID=UPI0017990406|nr:class I SAM-dependent methyltransferase [Hamadaea sp.]NUT19813.1 methyltransferase domain-containing protein [Hamadaea sp.]
MNVATWKLFDRLAPDYDEVVPFFAEFGAEIVATLDPPAGCRFLDLGAGRGALTGPALARGCSVTSIDASPAMCDRLAKAYPEAAVSVMNAQALEFPSGSFDFVASAFVIHLLDEPAAGVAEAYRVLAPGGRFGFTGGSDRPSTSPRPEQPAGPTLGSRLDGLFAEYTVHLPPGGSIGNPVDAADLLEEAGFVDLRGEYASVAIEFPDNETLWRWAMTHGYRAFIEDLPDAYRREFHQRVLELPDDDRILRRVTGIWSGRKP